MGTQRCRWREALALIKDAATDPSTPLGASLSGFTWPASIPEVNILRALTALISQDEASRAKNEKLLLPYQPDSGGKTEQKPRMDAEEYEAATVAMLEQFGIDPAIAAADIEAAKRNI